MAEDSDDLLHQLGQRARAGAQSRGAEDPVWEKLTRGELSSAEEAELRARVQADPELALLYEAYRPMGPAAHERMAQDAIRQIRSRSAGAQVPILSLRRMAFVAAPLLAAAAVAALVLSRPKPGPGEVTPAYAMLVTGGDRSARSATPSPTEDPIELHPGSRLEIVLRPATPAPRAVAVRAFLVQGGQARPWVVPMDRSSDGAVRVAGEAAALFGASAGSWEVAFVVGGDDVDPAEVARAAEGGPGQGKAGVGAHPWQLLERHVTLVEH